MILNCSPIYFEKYRELRNMNMSWQEHYPNPRLNTQDSSIWGEQGVVWLQCKHPLTHTHSHRLQPLYFHLSIQTENLSLRRIGKKNKKKLLVQFELVFSIIFECVVDNLHFECRVTCSDATSHSPHCFPVAKELTYQEEWS